LPAIGVEKGAPQLIEPPNVPTFLQGNIHSGTLKDACHMPEPYLGLPEDAMLLHNLTADTFSLLL